MLPLHMPDHNPTSMHDHSTATLTFMCISALLSSGFRRSIGKIVMSGLGVACNSEASQPRWLAASP